LVAPQHMQADVVARRNLGGSVQGLSGDGVDKRSHVRADGTVRKQLDSVVDDEPEKSPSRADVGLRKVKAHKRLCRRNVCQ
jgi:hypothetical protein